MDALLKKLIYKGEENVFLYQVPEQLIGLKQAFKSVTEDLVDQEHVTFALSFVYKPSELKSLIPELTKKAEGDAALWFCYPKKSSKRFKCEIDRDHGWDALGAAGYEPVRMIALDEDFSALRFRKVENIKKITRNAEMALTEEAKKLTTKGR